MIKEINSYNCLLKIAFAKSFKINNFNDLEEKSSFNSSNSYRGITEQAVNDLIERGVCICGAVISNGNDAYKHLIQAREHMEPRDYGKYVSDFISCERANYYNAKSSLGSILNHAGNVNDAISSYENDEKKLKEVKEKLEGRADVGEIQKQITTISHQLGQIESILNNLNNYVLPERNIKVGDLEKRIDKLTIDNSENDFINQCIAYAESIYRLADKKLISSKEDIKNRLQEGVGEIFKSMYHGNRLIKIGDDLRPTSVIVSEGKDKARDGFYWTRYSYQLLVCRKLNEIGETINY